MTGTLRARIHRGEEFVHHALEGAFLSAEVLSIVVTLLILYFGVVLLSR
jgi:hypothetical protein